VRRRGRPGLVGTMARTAVVAGTATAVVGGVSGHQQAKAQAGAEQQAAQQAAFESQAEVAQLQAQMNQMQAAQAPAAAPSGGGADMMEELKSLGELHASGVLSDDEFAAAKAKILA
jgi:Short C-terminal domain